MTDIQHEKYAHLISTVEDLEEKVYAMEQAKAVPETI
jgi:hypothetical protein